jgi:hypothetical protein
VDEVLIEFIETYTIAVSQLGNGGRYKTRNQKHVQSSCQKSEERIMNECEMRVMIFALYMKV